MKNILSIYIILLFSIFYCAAQKPNLILPIGHTDNILSINFSPDSKYIITTGADNTAKLWEAASGKLLFNLTGHKQAVRYANFSPDGKLIVTASGDSTAGIWEAATGRPVRFLVGHLGEIIIANFSPNGKFIVTASLNTAKVWDTSGNLLHNLVGQLNYANFSPNSKFIVTSSPPLYPEFTDSTAMIWETATGKLLASFKNSSKSSSPYVEVKIIPPQDSVAIFNRPSDPGYGVLKEIIIYNTLTIWYQIIDSAARVSPDEKFVISFSKDSTIKVWETGKLLYNLNEYKANVKSANFSPDSKSIIMLFKDSTVKILKTSSGKSIAGFSKYPYPKDSANFSPDGKFIIATSGDSTAKVWERSTGKLSYYLKASSNIVNVPNFSPGGNFIIGVLGNNTVEVWNSANGRLSYKLSVLAPVKYVHFSLDEKYIIIEAYEHTAKVWQASTGTLLDSLNEYNSYSAINSSDWKYILANKNQSKISRSSNKNLLFEVSGYSNEKLVAKYNAEDKYVIRANGDTIKIHEISNNKLSHPLVSSFSPDGKYFVFAEFMGNYAKVWNALDGHFLFNLKGHTSEISVPGSSPNGKYFISLSENGRPKIWEVLTGKLIYTLHDSLISVANFSPDGKYIITRSWDRKIKIWNSYSSQLIYNINAESAQFSPDMKNIAIGCKDSVLKIIDVNTWQTLYTIKRNTYFSVLNFSPDGKFLITTSLHPKRLEDLYIFIWKTATGEVLDSLALHPPSYANFSPDGKYIVTGHHEIRIWDASTRKPLSDLKAFGIGGPYFSPNGKYVITMSDYYSTSAKIYETFTSRLIDTLEGHSGSIQSANFSPDSKYFVTVSTYDREQSVKIFESATASLKQTLEGNSGKVTSAIFTSDGKHIVTASSDNTVKTWDVSTGKLLYTLIAIDSTDYLVLDTAGRFDGTDDARKLLYFTCGTEIIELGQLKDQLWLPNLIERIMKSDVINARKLSDMNICGLTPLVEPIEQKKHYRFKITPRRGGLGETVLYVNNIELRRYKPQQLIKSTSGYELRLTQEELDSNFISGQENTVSVKAYTQENDISSRGVHIIKNDTSTQTNRASLFAVMIGVSDYKDEDMDLKYAGKDATDISNTIGISARTFLNTDSTEHVFLYNLTTNRDHYRYPDKNSIKNVLQEIGKKAAANDILLIFFAGHGIMDSQKKRFYFLTADASKATISAAADVGISTDELSEWMKPANIKAQKRILIFDACQSGQAIREFVKAGQEGQGYLAARNDDRAQQIKAIDKLNDKSGLFIIAASASDQSAYEMGRYSQGLLTHALLKAIKQQPDILEDGKFLNVSRWFNAAEKTVSELMRETGGRQDPQVVSTSNINIGIVDDSVRAKIKYRGEQFFFQRPLMH